VLDEKFGPGNVVVVTVESEHATEVFTGFGERGTSAETVAGAAVELARAYLASSAAVGPHLADQLLIPLALAGGGSFTTVQPTRHTETNAEFVARYLPMRSRRRKSTKRCGACR
jgi:RNA 3'-terminal phosphate cyclase (ATP)